MSRALRCQSSSCFLRALASNAARVLGLSRSIPTCLALRFASSGGTPLNHASKGSGASFASFAVACICCCSS
jgi:hypothetical protein